MAFRGEVHHVRRPESGEHAVELVLVADVDLLEFETVGFRNRRDIFEIARVGELVDYADCIRRVVDDVPGDCRPDKSGSPGDDDAVHRKKRFRSEYLLSSDLFKNCFYDIRKMS